AAEDAGASPFARVGTRLFTFSTTTALVRPWLKLWRTTPCSTPRPLRVRVLLGLTLSFFSPVFSVVSAIPIPILAFLAVFRRVPSPPAVSGPLADPRRTRLRAGPKIVKARGARQKGLAFGAGEQGCMYHI